VRREAAERIGYFDPDFFVYSDEVDFCRRLADAGWHTLYVPAARAVHHEESAADAVRARRIVELSRNRDRYMRKHHSAASALAVRGLTAWTHGWQAVGALLRPGRSPKRHLRQVSAALFPQRGEGLAEAAAEYNRRLSR
jgi:GT2 family glycosyltransferase